MNKLDFEFGGSGETFLIEIYIDNDYDFPIIVINDTSVLVSYIELYILISMINSITNKVPDYILEKIKEKLNY